MLRRCYILFYIGCVNPNYIFSIIGHTHKFNRNEKITHSRNGLLWPERPFTAVERIKKLSVLLLRLYSLCTKDQVATGFNRRVVASGRCKADTGVPGQIF